MTLEEVVAGPHILELCREFARYTANQAVWAARRAKRHAVFTAYGQVPADPPANIIENASRAAQAVLEPWFIEHAEELDEWEDVSSALPDAVFEAAVAAAADQL